jgi:hypothetical protein
MIVGLSLIPSVQRLVVMIWRLATRHGQVRWARWRDFADAHWPSLVVQGGLVMAATLVFGFGLEDVVGGMLAESARQTYLAVLLFVKNPTVIAFTFVWMVGVVRQMVLSTSDTEEPVSATP